MKIEIVFITPEKLEQEVFFKKIDPQKPNKFSDDFSWFIGIRFMNELRISNYNINPGRVIVKFDRIDGDGNGLIHGIADCLKKFSETGSYEIKTLPDQKGEKVVELILDQPKVEEIFLNSVRSCPSSDNSKRLAWYLEYQESRKGIQTSEPSINHRQRLS